MITATKTPEKRDVPFASLDRSNDAALADAVDANPWPTTEELFGGTVWAMLRGALVEADVS